MRHGNLRRSLRLKAAEVSDLPAFVIMRSGVPWFSYDGVNWEQGTGTPPSVNIWGGAYNGEKFLFVGSSGALFESANGKDFTPGTISGGSGNIGSANLENFGWCEGLGRFVGLRTNNVYSSPDGLPGTWTNHSSVPGRQTSNNKLIVLKNGVLLISSSATSPYPTQMQYSTDLVNWPVIWTTSPGTSLNYLAEACAVGNGMAAMRREIDQSLRSADMSSVVNGGAFGFGVPYSDLSSDSKMVYAPFLDRLIILSGSNWLGKYSDNKGVSWSAMAASPAGPGSSNTRLKWSEAAKKFLAMANNSTAAGQNIRLSSDGSSFATQAVWGTTGSSTAIIAR